jgi:hypothetical protein
MPMDFPGNKTGTTAVFQGGRAGGVGEGRNPNWRNPKESRIPKAESTCIRHMKSPFEFWVSDLFQISGFELRIFSQDYFSSAKTL